VPCTGWCPAPQCGQVWLLLTLEDCRTTIADPVDAIVPPTQWAANDHDALLDG
jgi:hypothetical protein